MYLLLDTKKKHIQYIFPLKKEQRTEYLVINNIPQNDLHGQFGNH